MSILPSFQNHPNNAKALAVLNDTAGVRPMNKPKFTLEFDMWELLTLRRALSDLQAQAQGSPEWTEQGRQGLEKMLRRVSTATPDGMDA